jgi:hypothetical protein
MRKLIVAAAVCLAVGSSGTAFARGGHLIIKGAGGGSGSTAGTQPTVGSRHDTVFGTTTTGNTTGIGTETINGQTFVGTTQGQSGASGSPDPVVAGQPVLVLLGPDKGTTSKREACPGWMQTSGLDHCIRPQDQR